MKTLFNLLVIILFLSNSIKSQEYFYYWYADFGGAYHVTWPDNSTSGSMVSLEDIGGWATSIRTTNPATCLIANYNMSINNGSFNGDNNSGKSPAYISFNGNALYFGVDWTGTNTSNKNATAYFQFQRAGANIDAPVSFTIYDVNSNGCSASSSQRFIDEIEVYGVTSGGATIFPNLSSSSSNILISGNTVEGGVTSGGTNSAVNVSFATGINELYIVYKSGLGLPWNSGTCGGYGLGQQTTSTDPKSQYIIITPIQTNYDCSTTPLAVNYQGGRVNCQQKKKTISWITASEKNAATFEVYGINNDSSTLITSVRAEGNSTHENQYQIDIYTPYDHLRLVEKDVDGNKTILEDFTNFQCTDKDFKIYPNPAQNEFYIENIDAKEYNLIEIYDINGAKVLNQSIENHFETIDISSLSKGTYIIRLIGKQNLSTLPFIKS